MKYRIYLRVSTEKQDNRTQLDHALKFISQRDKSDFEYQVYQDVLTSKKGVFNRPGSKEMISDLERNDIIIGMQVDRLSRKSDDSHRLIAMLDKLGVDIFFVNQPGIENKIMLGLYIGIAEEEVKMLRKRVSQTLQAKKNRGERISGQLPFGYQMHHTKTVSIRVNDEIVQKPGILIECEKEKNVLKLMQEYSQAGYSYQEIANLLNDFGYKNREGRPFHKMSIYRLLPRTRAPKPADQLLSESKAHLFR